MPPLKKRKYNNEKAVVTLHQFFKPNSTQVKRCSRPSTSSRNCLDNEVIVIDSDCDEIEIFDEPQLDNADCTYISGRHSTKQSQEIEDVSIAPGITEAAFPSFGLPILLQSQPLATECPNSNGAPSRDELQRKPLFLPDEDDEPKYIDSPMFLPSTSSVRLDDAFNWGTGDDETNLTAIEGEGDEYLEDDDSALVPSTAGESKLEQQKQLLWSTDGDKNAFSVLMTSFKENEVWKEASKLEAKTTKPSRNSRREAPFYKVLQGMPVAVDAFRYGTIPNVTAYFLTHAHSDHYTNLSSSWKSGPIYCSEATANLIIHMLAVDKQWVNPLPMDVPTIVPNTGGVHVTLIEANHCPGSCLFFFEGSQTVNAGDSKYKSPFVGSSRIFRYLHCGDFRASPRHILHPAVKGKRIDHVYLDTTYLDPRYTFPPQPLVISACAELAKRISQGQSTTCKSTVDDWVTKVPPTGSEKDPGRSTLFVIGTYSIGKERILKAIAHALESKVYCDARKAALLRCQADDDLNALLCSDPLLANVHILPLAMITSDRLKIYLRKYQDHFKKVVGFRPTGWTYTPSTGTDQMPTIAAIISNVLHREYNYSDLKPSRLSTNTLQIYPVPYSEHSSFYELTCFAMSFSWTRMIATVNVGSASSRGKMAKWIARWEAEKRKGRNNSIIPYRHPYYW